jgi:hypothetical protein
MFSSLTTLRAIPTTEVDCPSDQRHHLMLKLLQEETINKEVVQGLI